VLLAKEREDGGTGREGNATKTFNWVGLKLSYSIKGVIVGGANSILVFYTLKGVFKICVVPHSNKYLEEDIWN